MNPAKCDPWGISSFQIWPNLVILIWSTQLVSTCTATGLARYNTMVYEGDLFFIPARTARERLAHEMAAVTYKEFALQDANTLEATQSMLESRAVDWFPLSDQEITCRHFHKTAGDWVDEYRRERAGAEPVADRDCRAGSPTWSRFVDRVVPGDRARAVRAAPGQPDGGDEGVLRRHVSARGRGARALRPLPARRHARGRRASAAAGLLVRHGVVPRRGLGPSRSIPDTGDAYLDRVIEPIP